MHIADGVVTWPVLASGSLLAAGGVMMGLRAVTPERLPVTALMTTVFFIASLLHIPIGPAQLHLVLNGLAGLLLGWAVFPAFLIALALQAVMFGYGGLTVLGLNTFIMAAPGLLAHLALRAHLTQTMSPRAAFNLGALTGVIGIGGAVILLTACLLMSGGHFRSVSAMIAASNLPLLVIETVVTGSAVAFIRKAKPELLPGGSDR